MTKINDLTKGKVSSVLLRFFFPMLFTNLLWQLYNFADTAIVGKGLGDNALAAVGNMSSMILLVTGFSQGITNGFSVVIAQDFGSKNMSALKKSIAASIRLSLILSAILTVLSIIFLKSVLIAIKTDDIILKDSLIYGYIIFGGLTATMAYNLCSCILRALGDSKTPFIAIIISSFLNIFLDCLFIFVIKTGVSGVACATILAQIVSVIICMIRLAKTEIVQITRDDFKSDLTLILSLIKNGIPMACMNSVTAVGCMIVQSYVNSLGVAYTSAYSACNKYVNLFMLPSVTAGFAISSFTAQNYGAKKYDRIKSGVRTGNIIGLVSYLVLGTIMVLFPHTLVKVFLNGNHALEMSVNFLRICGSMFFILNFLFIYRNAVAGMGKPVIPMCSGLFEMILRIFVIIVFLPQIGFKATAFAEIVAWAGALVLNFIAYLNIVNKKKHKT